MHKIALEPKEPHKAWAEGNGRSVEDSDTERRYHTSVLLRHEISLDKVLYHSPRSVLSLKSVEERIRMVNNIFPANPASR